LHGACANAEALPTNATNAAAVANNSANLRRTMIVSKGGKVFEAGPLDHANRAAAGKSSGG
jgi:hypothetical protein